MAPKPKPPIDRFLPKVNRLPTGCWQWTSYIDKETGYGRFGLPGGIVIGAHRFSYMYYKGPIADDMVLDHTCKNRWCVNPDHLEEVTLLVNLQRGDNSHRGRWQRETTHCPQGHEYSPDNTWISKTGARYCKTCNRERMRERRSRK